MGLLLYTHIPTALIALIFGIFLLYKNRSLPSVTLFIVCVAFALWCFLDISTWFAFLGTGNTMLTWSLLDLLGLFIFFFSYYFLYSFITGKDLPVLQKISGLLIIVPTAIWTFFGYNLTGFDGNYCEAVENETFTSYFFYIAGIFLIAAIILVIVKYIKSRSRLEKKTIILSGLGVIAFLGFFYSALLLVYLLVESNAATYAYNFEIYGLFGMPILLVYLGRLILRYNAFNLRLFSAQLLVFSLIALVGSQFAFLRSTANLLLNAATLILVTIFGISLIKGVKKEILQKEQLKKLSERLEDSNEKLKGLDKLKTEFLSLASHQLRSPLTAIKGYTSMLIEGSFGKLEDKQDEAVKRVYTSAQGLVNIVEDLLNVSKIEQGGMKYEFMATDVGKIVSDLYNEMKIPAESKGLTLNLSMPKYDQCIVSADPVKLKQVFLNLVDNSIKYTPKGAVSIALVKEGSQVIFSVSDTGVGISAETKATLFEKFHRGEGKKLNTGGSGLGLYLAREIARAHKGDVIIESEGLGKGSTFKVSLPALMQAA